MHFVPENLPNNEFKKEFLKSYYEEWFRLNDAEKPSDDEFDEFIDKELNKLIVNMLQARIYLLENSFYYISLYITYNKPNITLFRNGLEYYIVPIWEDYLKNKDKDLKLLEQSVSSHEVTIFLQNTMSICFFTLFGHLMKPIFFKF